MYVAFDYKHLASAITRARKLRKLTQTQLAAACNTDQATISRLENPANKHSVTLASLNKVASALGANMRVVFEPAEAETLAPHPAKKPKLSPSGLKELTIFEVDRLNRIHPDYLRRELKELREAGKRVPDETAVLLAQEVGKRWEPGEELTTHEAEQLQQMSYRDKLNEVIRLQNEGKHVPDKLLL